MSYPAENVSFSPVTITHRASSFGSVLAKPSRIAWSSAPRLPGFEIVSRTTPSAGSSSRSCPAASAKDNEGVALGHRLPLLDADLLDHTRVLRLHRHLHLHRLEDRDRISLLYGVANLDLDLPYGAGDVCLDV